MLLAAGALAAALTLMGSGHTLRASAEAAGAETLPYTDVAVPAENVVMLGATLAEPGAPHGATWGLGELQEGSVAVPKLVRRVSSEAGSSGEEAGWEPGPELPAGFQPDHPDHKPSPLEGQLTPEGYGVLVGTIPHEPEAQQVVLVRKPGGPFEATAPVPAEGSVGPGEEPLLHSGQTLFASARAPMIAPLREADGSAGALVMPVYAEAGVDEAVLHWDGHSWTSEPIEIPAESAKEFKVLALGASGPNTRGCSRGSPVHTGAARSPCSTECKKAAAGAGSRLKSK